MMAARIPVANVFAVTIARTVAITGRTYAMIAIAITIAAPIDDFVSVQPANYSTTTTKTVGVTKGRSVLVQCKSYYLSQ
jgi:hypothetical protein